VELRGKIALVTGAARRVGKAVALGLAESGARVIIHYHRSTAYVEPLLARLAELGASACALQADLADATQIATLARGVHERFGPLDILVNNASVFYRTPLENLDATRLDAVMNVNLRAPFLCSLFFGRQMKKAGRGKIINIADASSLKPSPDYIPYCVSKSALMSLTKVMAKALAPEVQVTCVAPGVVLPPDDLKEETLRRMRRSIPLRRFGTPEDVSRAVLFLAACGDFITGSTIFVDGGWVAG